MNGIGGLYIKKELGCFAPGTNTGGWARRAVFRVAPENDVYSIRQLQELLPKLVPEGLIPNRTDDFSRDGRRIYLGRLHFIENLGIRVEKRSVSITISDRDLLWAAWENVRDRPHGNRDVFSVSGETFTKGGKTYSQIRGSVCVILYPSRKAAENGDYTCLLSHEQFDEVERAENPGWKGTLKLLCREIIE